MNKIWTVMMLCSIAVLAFLQPSAMLPAMLTAGSEAVKLSINLAGIYLVWLGMMNIIDAVGLSKVLCRVLRPFVSFLFGKQAAATQGFISLNMSANILGLGNAATPMGIKAMQALDDGSGVATDAMIMLVVVNATSLQLLPTTILGIRAGYGSISAGDIILPTIIATLCTTISGILLAKLCAAFGRARKKHKADKSGGAPASPVRKGLLTKNIRLAQAGKSEKKGLFSFRRLTETSVAAPVCLVTNTYEDFLEQPLNRRL